ASFTVPKMGMPSKSVPALRGWTPATKPALPFAYSRQARVWNWPVLPVIPCVMTLVSLLIRMLIVGSSSSRAGRSRDHFLCRLAHRVGRDDRQAGLGEDALALVLVGALHAHHERHLQAHGLGGGHHALGDHVAAHDAAEDVHEDRLQVGIAQHDLECL